MKDVRDMKMKEIITELRKYCHSEACDTHNICPEQCCRRVLFPSGDLDPMLGMDTAIAWTAAHILDCFIGVASNRYKVAHYYELKSLVGVMNLSSSAQSYPRLWYLLKRAKDIMEHKPGLHRRLL